MFCFFWKPCNSRLHPQQQSRCPWSESLGAERQKRSFWKFYLKLFKTERVERDRPENWEMFRKEDKPEIDHLDGVHARDDEEET